MKGFISYSHEDYRAFKTLCTHLKALERGYGLDLWADRRISVGAHWTLEIDKAIKSAELFILLVSPDFIASDYVWNTELPAIEDRRKAGAMVLPAVLKPCSWQMIAGVLQAVPMCDGRLRPVSRWTPIGDGYDQVREQIGHAIERCFGLKPKAAIGAPL
jgi:hypothetical protein